MKFLMLILIALPNFAWAYEPNQAEIELLCDYTNMAYKSQVNLKRCYQGAGFSVSEEEHEDGFRTTIEGVVGVNGQPLQCTLKYAGGKARLEKVITDSFECN